METSRRRFLQTSTAMGSLVSIGLNVPGFLTRTACAAPSADKAGARDTILVVIEMTGGNDGLNTVVPFKDPEYAKLRPTLQLPSSQLKKINDSIGLHPSLTGLSELLHDQALSVVQGVGYPNPTQSHFRSMDIWQTGTTAENVTEGWLGRTLKAIPGTPGFHLKNNNEGSPLAVEGAPMRVPSIKTLEEFQLQLAAASGEDKKKQKAVIEGSIQNQVQPAGLLDFVQRTASSTYASSKRLQEIGRNYQPKAIYPNNLLADRLRLAAQLIVGNLGARIFYVSIGNFDTHASQAGTHAALLADLSTAITAFFKDLAGYGHRDQVLVMTFSEFGRRARENGSRGTDHGSAAPIFLVGGKVKPGVVGGHPSLTDLEQGNLKFHTDFRQVYATILDQWLGVPSKNVLVGDYQSLDFLKI